MQTVTIPPEIQAWLWNALFALAGYLASRYFPNLLPVLPKLPGPTPVNEVAPASVEQHALQLLKAGHDDAAKLLLGIPPTK